MNFNYEPIRHYQGGKNRCYQPQGNSTAPKHPTQSHDARRQMRRCPYNSRHTDCKK